MSPTPGSGLPQLDTALAVLGQVNSLLLGVPALIALGASIVQMVRQAGTTTEEAKVKIAEYEAAVDAALKVNEEWRAAHPRTGE